MMNASKKRILTMALSVIIVVIAIIVPILSVFITGLCLPPQYSQTYYGELAAMYSKLKSSAGKKIVILGNSSVAFGIDSALCQKLLKEGGLDYTVCNFGLYGALGTKMMCELAYPNIKKDDIVIFTPELYSQSLSTYFSGKEAWYALDSNMGMYHVFSSQSKNLLVGSYFTYTSEKLALYNSGEEAQSSGVYAKSSFDENCDMKNYSRPYNVMEGGVDENGTIVLDASIFSDDFLSFINDYAAKLNKKGAQIFYSFAPMNKQSVEDCSFETLEKFYSFISENLEFPVISDISDYIMDKEWFYDSNYHLNEYGMTVRTVNLVNDIKNQFNNTTKTEVTIPEKPIIPDDQVQGEGDNSCAELFNYMQDGNYYIVTGLTEEGRIRQKLVIPYQVNGLYIKSFDVGVFAEDKNVEEIIIQDNIRTIRDNSFWGCKNLKKLTFTHQSPSDISVGYGLLNNTSARIYVKRELLNEFKNDYFWGHFSDETYGY